MEINVKLFATLLRDVPTSVQERLAQPLRPGVPLTVHLPADSTVADLVALLRLPLDQVKVVFVHGRARPLDHPLADQDEVGIFPPIGGG